MAGYVDLNGIRMSYDEQGEGEPLVMLRHGGTDSWAFGPNLVPLASCFHIFFPERRGHGHTPDADGIGIHEMKLLD